ncbi:MAG: DUF1285 domain-containing protein [Sneathiellaceae bacterium]
MTRSDAKNHPAAGATAGGPAGTPDAEGLFEALRGEDWSRNPPPVDSWHPAREGEIDIRIARDGSWTYRGSPIGRQRMVRLFSTILRRDEDDEFYLVTPAEKLRIQVEDAPFVAVEMAVEGEGEAQRLVFRTNVNEVVTADAEHPIRVEVDPVTAEPAPYIAVRGRLQALIARSVFYDLVELAGAEATGEGEMLVVRSAGSRFVLGPVPDDMQEG